MGLSVMLKGTSLLYSLSVIHGGIGWMLLGGWCIEWWWWLWRSLLVGWVVLAIFIVDIVFIFITTVTFTIIIIRSPPPSSSPQTASPQHSPPVNFFVTIKTYFIPSNPTYPYPFPSTNKSSHTDSPNNYTSLRIDANYPSIKRYSSLSTLSSSDCLFSC